MITDTILQKYWAEKLIQIPSKVLRENPFDEPTRQFLRTVGLPPDFAMEWPWGIRFRDPDRIERLMSSDTGYIIIGDGNGGVLICVNDASSEILALDPSDDLSTTFINSSVRSLVIFIYVLTQLRTDLDTRSYREKFKKVKFQMLQYDKVAIEGEETWWGTLVEEIEESL